ncbi:hypothetical protein Vafri_661 [Volvox africanus]|nr:hypothetical protein Vafri_661 [Volvox africanus]
MAPCTPLCVDDLKGLTPAPVPACTPRCSREPLQNLPAPQGEAPELPRPCAGPSLSPAPVPTLTAAADRCDAIKPPLVCSVCTAAEPLPASVMQALLQKRPYSPPYAPSKKTIPMIRSCAARGLVAVAEVWWVSVDSSGATT